MRLAYLLLAAGIAASTDAAAQTFRCVGKDGKKYYGSTLPTQCIGQPTEQLNAQGRVIRRIDAQASAEELKKREIEEQERKKREAITKEEGRRNRALLATYTSEKDIDQARSRALKENEAAVKDIERRIEGLKKRRAELSKELDFYQGKNKPPAKLQQDIRNAEFDIRTQEQSLALKQKEVDSINARYDEDKKRYLELTKGSAK